MKSFLATVGLTLLACAVSSAQVTEQYTYNPNASIPDNSTVGVADSHVISSAISLISNVTVSLTINGGFDGDYYAYLVHDGGFTVLLNRIGRTSANSLGSSGSGIDVTFSDLAPNGDIHNAPKASPVTGTWQADGRNVNPSIALDSSPRTTFLASFNGLNANGTWTLFVNDNSPVGTGIFASWSLQITGAAIPEPQTYVLALLGTAVLGSAFSRKRTRHLLGPRRKLR